MFSTQIYWPWTQNCQIYILTSCNFLGTHLWQKRLLCQNTSVTATDWQSLVSYVEVWCAASATHVSCIYRNATGVPDIRMFVTLFFKINFYCDVKCVSVCAVVFRIKPLQFIKKINAIVLIMIFSRAEIISWSLLVSTWRPSLGPTLFPTQRDLCFFSLSRGDKAAGREDNHPP